MESITVTFELVSLPLSPSLTSVAVTVQTPASFSATSKVWMPPARAALAGSVAPASLEVSATTSVTVLMKFQLSSTARTVTVNGTSTDWVSGAPVLPVGVPGAAVSPGSSTCSFVNSAAPTVITLEVAAFNAPLVNRMVMFVTSGWARFVYVATPATAAMFVVPSRSPAPARRVAVTTRVSLLRQLPNTSSIRTAGCCANGTPATAVADGWVAMTSLFAAPGTTS